MSDLRIPFGKYKGSKLSDIPLDYLSWALNAGLGWFTDHRAEILEAYRKRTDAGDEEDARTPIILKADQQEAVEQMHDAIDRGEYAMRIGGGAGYGKSAAVRDLARQLIEFGYRVTACAPSYVASQSLARVLKGLPVQCGTVASTLRLEKIYRQDKELYVPGGKTIERLTEIFSGGGVLLVDEYSMIDDELAGILLDQARSNFGHLILVGDPKQLCSPAQNHDSLLCSVEANYDLFLPKRYVLGSDLFRVEQLARIDPWRFDRSAYAGSTEVSVVPNTAELIDRFVAEAEVADGQTMSILTYKRATSSQINDMVRARLFGSDVDEIVPGEHLRVQRTSDAMLLVHPRGDTDTTHLRKYSGTSIVVARSQPRDLLIPVEGWGAVHINCHVVIDQQGFGYPVIFAINENKAKPGAHGSVAYDQIIQQFQLHGRQTREWAPLNSFREQFCYVDYGYATTVHKVQGQTLDYAFINPAELLVGDPYVARRLAYVAMTRASKQLITT